ncbi:MAG: hypothetical protein KIS96_01180 [Bauldia sp.]|nr:hypothetical protein [Bauldia sp.]
MGISPGGIAAIGIGMQAMSILGRSFGERAAALDQKRKAEFAARVGMVAADQIDTAYRQELAATVSNIRAIQASAGVNVGSPSAQAFLRGEEAASDGDRATAVASARLQAGQHGLDAIAYRRAARWSLIGGAIGAGSTLIGIAGLF